MPKNKILTAIGLMSGTSLDGIDVAILKTDGKSFIEFGPTFSQPYDGGFIDALKNLIQNPHPSPAVEKELTIKHAQAVEGLLKKSGLNSKNIDLIGFHGQTILHDPDKGKTWQIGDGQLLSKLTGIGVINDFRSNDVLNGGEGAPLVPIFHQAIASGLEKPVIIVNIGGIANITWVGVDQFLAFDIGPGNCLLNDFIYKNKGLYFDLNGMHARQGRVHEEIVKEYLKDRFFDAQPPKSLDRTSFSCNKVSGLSVEDGCATLLEFTVESFIKAERFLPQKANHWLIAGGGRRNEYLVERLRDRLDAKIDLIDEHNIDGDMLEAYAFAYLAVRSYYDLPISFPGTTGVAQPQLGGVFCQV